MQIYFYTYHCLLCMNIHWYKITRTKKNISQFLQIPVLKNTDGVYKNMSVGNLIRHMMHIMYFFFYISSCVIKASASQLNVNIGNLEK